MSCALVIKVSCALVIKVPKRCVAILIAIDLLGRSGVGSPQATPTFKSALVRPTFTVALVLDPSKTRQHALTVYCLACCMLTDCSGEVRDTSLLLAATTRPKGA